MELLMKNQTKLQKEILDVRKNLETEGLKERINANADSLVKPNK